MAHPDGSWSQWSGVRPGPHAAPFRVDENGNLYASSATIVGDISASTWTSDNFSVDTDGNVEAKNITVTGGIIGGCTFSEEGGILQITSANITGQLAADKIDADSIVTKGRIEGLGCDFESGSIGGWTITGSGIYSDGGTVGLSNAAGSAHVRFYAGSVAPTIAPFRVLDDGTLYADSANITGSIISWNGAQYAEVNGGAITLVQNPPNGTNASCQFASVGFSTTINNTNTFSCGVISLQSVKAGIGWTGGAGIVFGKDEGYFEGTWETPSAIATTSDINKKNSITDIPDTYRTIFDNLKPKIYKYNDGKSDRYHVGFIAQDVEEAIVGAGLTTQDFAGFVRTQLPNEETGEPENVCMLRYEEFIALNTWQIQKILPRLHELESEVTNLK